MKCIKQLALIEPLVDTCNANQIISDSCAVLEVDIYTVKKEDLDFESKFELKMNRDDYCHALVAYFNIDFSTSHTKLTFSTGPRAKYTHWKQTVFYLDEEMVVNTGDTLTGKIKVKRNAKNPRDIDIQLTTRKEAANGSTPEKTQQYHLR